MGGGLSEVCIWLYSLDNSEVLREIITLLGNLHGLAKTGIEKTANAETFESSFKLPCSGNTSGEPKKLISLVFFFILRIVSVVGSLY